MCIQQNMSITLNNNDENVFLNYTGYAAYKFQLTFYSIFKQSLDFF